MLKGIDPLLGPDLLHCLRAMGHGDQLVIADANFPASSVAQRLLRLDGVSATTALAAILTVFPLDQFVPAPVAVMQVVGKPGEVPDTVRDFQQLLDRAQGGPVLIEPVERFAFYERSRAAYAVVVTGERRFYGNVILAKGVISPPAAATA